MRQERVDIFLENISVLCFHGIGTCKNFDVYADTEIFDSLSSFISSTQTKIVPSQYSWRVFWKGIWTCTLVTPTIRRPGTGREFCVFLCFCFAFSKKIIRESTENLLSAPRINTAAVRLLNQSLYFLSIICYKNI
jgi:hypothetical protein